MNFNIWDIRQPILRALVAWLLVFAAVSIAAAALPFMLVWLAIAGVIGGLRAAWGDHEWRETGQWAWAAMTGKGEPV